LKEKRQFFELTTKKRSSEFLPGKYFRKIGHFFGWSQNFLRPDSRITTPRLRTRLTSLCCWTQHSWKRD